MDVDFGFNHIKTTDTNMNTYFLCFKKLLRITEILLILVFLSWLSTRLPFAVRISGEYFRHLISLILTPLFIFLIGNLIVLTLFFKSRHLKLTTSDSELNFDYFVGEDVDSPVTPEQKESVVYQDKGTILEETAKVVKNESVVVSSVKVHKRSQSMDLRKVEKEGGGEKKLRRSETEKVRRGVGEKEEEMADEMSNEEFQKAIEEFIAKQVKFHQEEKLAIVLHSNNTV